MDEIKAHGPNIFDPFGLWMKCDLNARKLVIHLSSHHGSSSPIFPTI